MMSVDDSISSITVDTPIAVITVFDWPLGIFVPVMDVDVLLGLADKLFVVTSNRNH